MPYEINKISSEYSKKGRAELCLIQAVLIKNGMTVLETTPTYIRFAPWEIQDRIVGKCVSGSLKWNPVNRMASIEYHMDLPYPDNPDQYSLILKWYLSKWNERHENRFSHTEIRFIYPGQVSSDLVLKACRKMPSANMNSRIKKLLLQMHDIIEAESSLIADIVTGNCPEDLKQDLLAEISGMLSELWMPNCKGTEK